MLPHIGKKIVLIYCWLNKNFHSQKITFKVPTPMFLVKWNLYSVIKARATWEFMFNQFLCLCLKKSKTDASWFQFFSFPLKLILYDKIRCLYILASSEKKLGNIVPHWSWKNLSLFLPFQVSVKEGLWFHCIAHYYRFYNCCCCFCMIKEKEI